MDAQFDVYLSPDELAIGNAEGERLREISLSKGLVGDRNMNRTPEEILLHHKRSQVVELAMCKLLGKEYTLAVGVYHTKPDVGRFEIRSAQKSHKTPILVVREDDFPDRIFVLGVLDGDCVRFVGWMYGHQVMKPKYLRTDWAHKGKKIPWGAPEPDLLPMDMLMEFGGVF